MPKLIDLTDKVFGRLKVVKVHHRTPHREFIWLCTCNCGNIAYISGKNLRYRKTLSCGCLHKEISSRINLSHGMYGTHFYAKWSNMLTRVRNTRYNEYYRYGGRGIKVCKRWLKFENFLMDMFESYRQHLTRFGKKQTTLDRIDNDGNYKLSNCRWATYHEQKINQIQKLAREGKIDGRI